MYTNWKYIYYIGQASPSPVAAALVEFGVRNATIYLAKGLWKDVAEVTTTVEIIGLIEQDVLPLGKFLRAKFNQSSILVTKEECHYMLVEA